LIFFPIVGVAENIRTVQGFRAELLICAPRGGGDEAALTRQRGGRAVYATDCTSTSQRGRSELPADATFAARMQLVLSLDPALQLAAKAAIVSSAVEAREHQAGEAALVAMNTRGQVLALIGGRDFSASQFDRATVGSRQIGSTFKPFIYLAALESGFSSDSGIADTPVAIDGWSPRNYDGQYVGRMTLIDALAGSRNAAAVRLGQRIGIDRMRETAQRFGLPVSVNPAFLLGAEARDDWCSTSIVLVLRPTSLISLNNWFVGFSGGITAAVWMGNDDGRPMRVMAGASCTRRSGSISTLPLGAHRNPIGSRN
jgi:membrane peptidoglycan carboxypeptidase